MCPSRSFTANKDVEVIWLGLVSVGKSTNYLYTVRNKITSSRPPPPTNHEDDVNIFL